jgi:hypothetical protein
MKNTQAWGWLVAGVLALGLNGFYQDGGTAWAHRAVNGVMARISDRSGAAIAFAAGRVDWFMAKAETAAARQETTSCRLATAMARVQTKMARGQSGMARFEAMSAREEAALARLEANRARVEAKMARVRFSPAMFNPGAISVACPRVHVNLPRISVPEMPMVQIPEIHVETIGAGPV